MASSTLNPNAPMLVPSEYGKVDLSDQWWDLVHSSHYWLHECFSDPQTDLNFDTEQEENNKELITLGLLQWNKSRFTAEGAKNRECSSQDIA